jgi:DNA topoisomerase-1
LKAVIIIIAEKPDAALRIASALAEKDLRSKKSKYGVQYWEFQRDGKEHIVVSAVGHLFNLKQVEKGCGYPVLDNIEWVPSFMAAKKSSFSERYFNTIKEVAKNNKEYDLVSACDLDEEGSLIAERIIRLIFRKDDARRMKFSTLVRSDLTDAYDNMMPHLDWGNILAGETRHYLDYFYGINTSRALMSSIKKASKRFAILSAGRVQAPTLVLLADREMEIRNFVPQPYWQLQLILSIDGNEFVALYEKERIWDKKEAEGIFEKCKDKPAIVDDIKKKKYVQPPPLPFNITSLQTEAYRLFGFSPQYTMSIAQKLYTSAYISYPRSSSEKIPEQLGYRQILEALSKFKNYERLCKTLLMLPNLKPKEGEKIDAAHYAIVPTQEVPQDIKYLSGPAQKIYDLICRRFLALFAKNAIRENMEVVIDVDGNKFLASGRRTLEKGWMEFYGPYAKFDELILPDLKEGDELNVKNLEILDKKTSPLPRYSQASIIKEMERLELGTRATRGLILQTLYDRNYITDKIIRVTDLGLSMASVIKKYVPDFADEKLTRKFEKDLEEIMLGKEKKEKVLDEAKVAVTKICEEFRQHEDEIGKELGEAIIKMQDVKSVLGKCPSCGKDLKVMFSPKTRKYFVGCTGYKDGCRTSYPLPHGASFQRMDKVCDKCKTPIIKVIRRGRRPFNMCLDTHCETKADWGKRKVSKRKSQTS